MITLEDVLKTVSETEARISLFGPDAEFREQYQDLLNEIADAVCKENKTTRDQALFLSPETLLGSGSNLALGKMKKWLHKKLEIDPHTLISI